MAKVKIIFPQVVFTTREIEVSDEKFEDLILHKRDNIDFMWKNMTEQEQEWTEGQCWISKLQEVGLCGVYRA